MENDTVKIDHREDDPAAAHPRRWLILGVVCVAVFVTTLDGLIVNIALPSLSDVASDIDDPPAFSRSRLALAARDGRLLSLTLPAASAASGGVALGLDAQADAQAQERRGRWIGNA